MSIGCCLWVMSLAGSGFAYFMPRVPFVYWFFLVSRAFSGFGEACFQTLVPAYVEDLAPDGSRALWLSILYMSIPDRRRPRLRLR